MAAKKSAAKTVRSNKKGSSTSRRRNAREKKIIKAVAITVAILLVCCILIGIGSGMVTLDELLALFIPEETASPSDSVSPSPETGTWSDNVLLIGSEISGGELNVHFIDVGQGDSIFIEFPDGKTMLIDGGKNDSDVADTITSYLNALNVTIIDYVMLTHSDEDHVGSLDAVLDTYEVKTLYIPDLIASDGMENEASVPGSISTVTFRNFMERTAIETYTEGGTIHNADIIYNIGTLSISGSGYAMTMYCPTAAYYDAITNNSSATAKNNMSPICVLTYAGRTIIFTGDADEDAEQRYVYDSVAVDADVLKVAHHGGADSSNDFFLNDIDAEYAVISCGMGNDYDHPRQATLDRLVEYGAEYVFRTDLNSDILLTIDESGDMRFLVKNYVVQGIILIGADIE